MHTHCWPELMENSIISTALAFRVRGTGELVPVNLCRCGAELGNAAPHAPSVGLSYIARRLKYSSRPPMLL